MAIYNSKPLRLGLRPVGCWLAVYIFRITGLDVTIGKSVEDKTVNYDDNNNDNNGGNTSKLNGLASSEDGNWYYYADGVVATDYTGFAENEYGWWKVTNGMVDFGYTGQADNAYGTWNVVNGYVVM